MGVSSLVAGYYLADLITRFQRAFPNVQTRVVEDERSYIEHLLVVGQRRIPVARVRGDALRAQKCGFGVSALKHDDLLLVGKMRVQRHDLTRARLARCVQRGCRRDVGRQGPHQ